MAMAYGACFLVSAAVFVFMAQKGYSGIDVNYWTIAVLVPIVIMGYFLKTQVTTPETARVLFCFIYLDSTFLVAASLLCMMRTLGFTTRPWLKSVVYIAAFVHIAIVCLSVHNDSYYQSMQVMQTSMGSVTRTESGPMKAYHYAFLAGIVVWFASIVSTAAIRKGSYSRRAFGMFCAVIGTGLVMYLAETLFHANFTLLPIVYTVGDIAIAHSYDYMYTHDIAYVIANQQTHSGSHGYVAINPNGKFLSCNAKALDYLPFLKEQHTDAKIAPEGEHERMVLELVDACGRDGTESAKYQIGDMTCACEIAPFSAKRNGEMQGYLLDIRDATEEQRNLNIITSYNETLNAEVIEKTENIRDIQQKVVLGMANMIENRDNNTGGHVKRTSDIIRILVDEVIRQGNIRIDEKMASDIVRAAPTHDLGKVSIDSSILNKPGRFTDEEYEIMKTHSAKSGEMVLILLEGVEEDRFVKVAFNVARYHHERWDGRGYPDGLVGTMIPLEARIMAVADVYDALVSKRVYKEPMSFEKAYSIMCESMGTQFDPNMKPIFVGCREQLEQYYREHA